MLGGATLFEATLLIKHEGAFKSKGNKGPAKQNKCKTITGKDWDGKGDNVFTLDNLVMCFRSNERDSMPLRTEPTTALSRGH